MKASREGQVTQSRLPETNDGFEQHKAMFLDVLGSEAVTNINKDPRIAAFSAATLDLYHNDERQRSLIDEFIARRGRQLGASALNNLLLRSRQKQLLRRPNVYETPPGAFTKLDDWVADYGVLLGDSEQLDELRHDIFHLNAQSNISGRGKGPKAVALLHGLPAGSRWLDIGCSQNHVLKKIALNLDFDDTEIVTDYPEHGGTKDALSSALMTELLEQALPLGPSIGVDIIPIGYEGGEWPRACSFTPSEFVERKDRVVEYDAFEHITIPEVSFVQADFVNQGRYVSERPQQFDFVNLSTFLNQLYAEKRVNGLSNAYWHTSRFIVVQDFVDVDPRNPFSLHFKDNWLSYSYQTLVFDRTEADKGFQKYFTWESGRCDRAIVNPEVLDKLQSAATL